MKLPALAMLLAQGLASHLFLAGVLVLTVTLIYRTQRRLIQLRRRYAERSSVATGGPTEQENAAAATAAANPAAPWEVQLHQVARQYLAQAQTQSAVLERQLREARALSRQLARQLEQLRQLQAELAAGKAGSASAGCEPKAAEQGGAAPSQNALEMAARGCSARQIAAALGRPEGEVELLLRLHRPDGSA